MRLGNYLPTSERIKVLKQRGLKIDNEAEAQHFLEDVDYYRLIRYVSVFQETQDQFKPNVTFEHIVDVYNFDKALRNILFDIVDTVEISMRARIITEVGTHLGAFGYLDGQFFSNKRGHKQFLIYLKDKLDQRIAEEVIDDKRRHHLNEVPVWQALELCTFNMLLNFYLLLPKKAQDNIARSYNAKQNEFVSWIQSFVVLRNVVAHHGRLFDRRFGHDVVWQTIDQVTFSSADTCSFVAVLYAVKKVMLVLDEQMYSDIVEQLQQLFEMFPIIQKEWLGSADSKIWETLLTIS